MPIFFTPIISATVLAAISQKLSSVQLLLHFLNDERIMIDLSIPLLSARKFLEDR